MEDMQAVIDAARASSPAADIFHNNKVHIVYTPRGANGEGQIHKIDVEKYQGFPTRPRGVITVFDIDSFNRVLVDHGQGTATTVYVNPDAASPGIVAVLNGNGADFAGWGDHRVVLQLRKTPQWVKWNNLSGKLISQTDFAEFIEENMGDIKSPAGAEVMEMATHLQAIRAVAFTSKVHLQSGKFTFQHDENIEASVGAGQVQVPNEFTLALSPFHGVAPFAIIARFRYRLESRKLLLGVTLQRIEDTVAHVIEEITGGLVVPEGVAILFGLPPEPTPVSGRD